MKFRNTQFHEDPFNGRADFVFLFMRMDGHTARGTEALTYGQN
jgi:hypothetical protein